MTQTAAICIALLKGEILTIFNGYTKFNCSNLPREISRGIEQKFGILVSRVRRDFISEYAEKPGYYYEYRLNKTLECNKEGVQKMIEYVKKQTANSKPP